MSPSRRMDPVMLFNSLEFFVFLAVVYVSYRLLPFRWQNWMLLVAGYTFYGAWDVRFLFLIAFSTTVDFCIGLLLSEGEIRRRQRWTASLFLIGAAFVFLCIDWSAFSLRVRGPDWAVLLRPRLMGLYVLAGVLVFLLIAQQLIRGLANVPDEARRRTFIVCSVVVNLAFLGCFKYFNFFIDSGEYWLHRFGVESSR